ncbi:MAG: terpene utilization protein AtuA, partial [Burkholderiaceae bacterium]
VVRLFSFLLAKTALTVEVDIDGARTPVAIPLDGGFDPGTLGPARQHPNAATETGDATAWVPLLALAHGRSGDKGDTANIGLIARRAEDLPRLSAWLTPERVAAHFAHRSPRLVERFDLPGLNAINFVLHGVLGGGGTASLHTDNLAKAYAQVLLAMDIPASSDGY